MDERTFVKSSRLKPIQVLLFLMVIPFLTNAQIILEGRFRKTALYSTEILEFKGDGSFSFNENSCGLAYCGKGHYFLGKKTIVLEFDPQRDKTIGVFSKEIKKDSSKTQSTIQVFDGFKHRNDIGFSYAIYLNDSLVIEGNGDAYHDLGFDPAEVDSIRVKTFFKTSDFLVPYQENKISIASCVAYNYTLLSLSKNGLMVVGQSHNKRYEIRLNRSKTKFKVRGLNKTWVEYKLFQN